MVAIYADETVNKQKIYIPNLDDNVIAYKKDLVNN